VAVVSGCLLAACRSPRREVAALECPSEFAASAQQLAASGASALQAALLSAESAVRHALVAAAEAEGRRAAAAPRQEAVPVAVVVLPQAEAGAVPVAAVVLPLEAAAVARVGAAAPRQVVGAVVPDAPARRPVARLSAGPWVFRRDQPPPWPERSPAVPSARAREELRTALPSERWWQAVQGEGLS
jgi:hypothetical protein